MGNQAQGLGSAAPGGGGEAAGQCRSVLCAVCAGVGPQTVTAAQHSQALFLATSARPSWGAWHLLKVRRGASAGPQLTGDRDPHDPGPGLGQPESG